MSERVVSRGSRFLLAVLLAVGLGGCGVAASDSPVDEGDAVAGGSTTTDSEIKPPPVPNAGTAGRLVEDFLMTASGGLAVANDRAKAFLTDKARQTWRDPENKENPSLTIVRVLGGPTTGAAVNLRTPVTVEYQVVGTLGVEGFINELRDLTAVGTVGTMVFWVVAENETNLRVDEISGPPLGLMLSDQALKEYYRPQPIYFWDQAGNSLVPDLRYVPLTITAPQRANQLLRWLVAGPSPWLSGGVQRMPQYITSDPPQSDNGTLVVKLSSEAAGGGPVGLSRLRFQLQWSLSTPQVALSIDDIIQPADAPETEYLQHNISRVYDSAPQRYDINAEKVVPVPEGMQGPAVLAMPENANVVSAAVGHGGEVAAFVRTIGNSRRLHIVREGMPGRFEPNLTQSSTAWPARLDPTFRPATDRDGWSVRPAISGCPPRTAARRT